MDLQGDADRFLYLEDLCKTAEANYSKNPLDADNLTRWGGALLELSQFQNIQESKSTIQDVISKLDDALVINPKNPETLWCLGNAYASSAFLIPGEEEAKECFDKSVYFFTQAVFEDPSNEVYRKSLEVSAKAPALHQEIYKPDISQQTPEQATGNGKPSVSINTSKDDLDRLFYFEHARKIAESKYLENPLDAENLTNWGGALVEISQFQNVQESKSMIKDAIPKLEEALRINPKMHPALWCLGSAHTSSGFLTPDKDEAKNCFEKGAFFYKRAFDEDPSNKLYIESLELSAKAHEMHNEIYPLDIPGGGGQPSNSITCWTAFVECINWFKLGNQVDK